MRFFKLFFLSLIVLPFILSCREQSLATGSDDLPRDFTLQAGERVLFNDIDFQFERVAEDYRCPKGVQCVTGGVAKVLVNYTVDNKPIQKSLLIGATQPAESEMTVGDTRLILAYLKPAPAANIKIDPASYRAHFIAYKKGDLSDARVIDVRTEEEYQQGHYQDATLLPVATLTDTIGSLNLDKTQQIVVYCRSGNRAGKAKVALEKLGYKSVINGVNKDIAEYIVQ
ncbi:rhodanese-like domain-containing protein [Kangiella shandongensis]|uniref:rhodanese-like domain-containing protein n=1 Tax=Kangiella shandongensis TaxID=2763258 RepID=UPI001CBF2B92|nr:rhodanese-like domain-containing protein [Kangiella shandongensis]